MNARPVPMVETHKIALLTWLRERARYGQGAPSDRSIATRLGLRSTDDALALVQALAAAGDLNIENEGLTRHLVLRDPPTPKGTQPVSREAMEAASAANPPPAMERAPVRSRPAPISLVPPRALFVPVITIPVAPITAPAPAPAAPPKPEEAIMSKRAADRKQINLSPTPNDYLLIAARAEQEGITVASWSLNAIRARLLATTPAVIAKPPAGKPRLSARVIRIANADEREFWVAISHMIELGATTLIEQQNAAR